MKKNKLNKSLIKKLIVQGKILIESSKEIIEESKRISFPNIKEPFRLK